MSNPSLYYMPHLQQEIADEYRDWKDHPEQNGDFVTKRMGIRAGFKEITEYGAGGSMDRDTIQRIQALLKRDGRVELISGPNGTVKVVQIKRKVVLEGKITEE